MASFLLSATTITFLLFVLSPSSSADDILDSNGKPLINGASYFILAHNSKTSAGLTLKDPTGFHRVCPKGIKTVGPGDDGMSLKISSPYRTRYLSTSTPLEITFNSIIIFCGPELRWWVTPSDANDNAHIVVGTSGPFKPNYVFLIQESYSGKNVYNIKFCHLLEPESELRFRSTTKLIKVSDDDDEVAYVDNNECRDVTFLEDGTLGVSKNARFPFVFKKKPFPFLAANSM